MDRTIKIAAIIGIALISFAVFYYLVFFLPHKEQAKINLQKQAIQAKAKAEKDKKEAEEEREMQMEDELSAAYEDYQSNWKREAKRLGRKDNTLPAELAKRHEQAYKEAKEEVLRKYGK